MQSVRSLAGISGVRVLVRTSLNVPTEGEVVLNDFRLRKSLESIELVRKLGAKVILASHVSGDTGKSLLPAYTMLKKYLPISFVEDIVGERAKKAIVDMKEGQVLLLENLRRHRGEEGNDLTFAKQLAALGDIYVNDDFSVMHRKHASVVLVPGILQSYAGCTVLDELVHLERALQPTVPAFAIMGGAKFHTKEQLVRNCLPIYDQVFIGGAIANDFLRAKGYEVGRSLVATDRMDVSDIVRNPKVVLPVDVTVDGPNGVRVVAVGEVAPTESILDVGPKTIELLRPYIARASTILWNGPLGNYEHGFSTQTEALAELVVQSRARAVLGGGDTIAAVEKVSFDPSRIFLSTGGGSMIEFLSKGTLPGLEALGYRKSV
jgi:phosphoglycerate kinase